MKIVVHIDRLMLDGLPANTDVRRLGAEIERELSKSLTGYPLERWRGATIDRIASSISDAHGSFPLGRGVALALQSAIASTQAGAGATIPVNRSGGPQ
jgi:hypothetical protein